MGNSRRIVILYGSETGTAQDLAEQIWRESKRYHFESSVQPMNLYPVQQLVNEKLVVFVCSTTGIGDEPNNMKVFWKFLLRKSLPSDSLEGMRFAVLGLGDSSYEKFNFVAKKLNKRILQLGGRELIKLGLCDDQHDLGSSAVSVPWLEELWKKLLDLYPVPSGKKILETSPVEIKWKTEIIDEDKENENWVRQELGSLYKNSTEINVVDGIPLKLLSNEKTTAEDHFQDVRLLSFDSSGLSWKPGDVLVVRPQNSSENVSNLFQLFQEHKLPFHPENVVKISEKTSEMPVPDFLQKAISLRCLATQYWDLNAIPRPRTFILLAKDCENDLEREKLIEFSSVAGQEDLFSYANRPRRTTLEVLYDFPHATSQLKLETLMELFQPIKPRSFSIASSCLSGKLDLLVAVVEYKTKLSVPRKGLCSNWLKSLQVDDCILGWLKRGTMTLPQKRDYPVIMVGPGTGLAPFRSLLQEKYLMSVKNIKDILVFGCRSEQKDFHCRDDLLKWKNEDLIHLVTAFSRDQEEKIYVQHKIAENCDLIKRALISESGTILVAGNSKNMPKAVKDAFIEAIGNEDFIKDMIKSKKYQEETWN